MPPLSTGNSNAANNNQINNAMRDIKQRQTTDIRKDDNGTRRILFGKGADNFYGMKVSPEGVDVYTATDDQLIFNSNQNVFKIVSSGTINTPSTIPSNPGAGNYGFLHNEVSVNHSLGYRPAILAYIQSGTGSYSPLPYVAMANTSATQAYWINTSISVTDTTVTLSVSVMVLGTSTGLLSFPVKYYLLQETAD